MNIICGMIIIVYSNTYIIFTIEMIVVAEKSSRFVQKDGLCFIHCHRERKRDRTLMVMACVSLLDVFWKRIS